MKTGIEMIAEERQRQIDIEDYTAENDAQYIDGELALAAASYALAEHNRKRNFRAAPTIWPWHERDWKPNPENRARELIKAGALIAAELDRLNALNQSNDKES